MSQKVAAVNCLILPRHTGAHRPQPVPSPAALHPKWPVMLSAVPGGQEWIDSHLHFHPILEILRAAA